MTFYHSRPTVLAQLKVETKIQNPDKSGYTYIGKTRVTVEQGIVFSEINWGIDGSDMPVSTDIATNIEAYIVSWNSATARAVGIYKLRDKKSRAVLATAKVSKDSNSHTWFIKASDRARALELFELLQKGKIRPAEESEVFEQQPELMAELRQLRASTKIDARTIKDQAAMLELTGKQLDKIKDQTEALLQTVTS